MPAAGDILERGRESFGRHAWADAVRGAVRRRQGVVSLEPEDLDASRPPPTYLIGHDDESIGLASSAPTTRYLGARRRPARRALRVLAGLRLLLGGARSARGGGWLARGPAAARATAADCVEQGYLLVPVGVGVDLRRATSPRRTRPFGQAAEIGERFGDADLVDARPPRPGPRADPPGRDRRGHGAARRGHGRRRRAARCRRSSPATSTAASSRRARRASTCAGRRSGRRR